MALLRQAMDRQIGLDVVGQVLHLRIPQDRHGIVFHVSDITIHPGSNATSTLVLGFLMLLDATWCYLHLLASTCILPIHLQQHLAFFIDTPSYPWSTPLLIQVGQTMRIRREGLVDIPKNVASTTLTEGLRNQGIPCSWTGRKMVSKSGFDDLWCVIVRCFTQCLHTLLESKLEPTGYSL